MAATCPVCHRDRSPLRALCSDCETFAERYVRDGDIDLAVIRGDMWQFMPTLEIMRFLFTQHDVHHKIAQNLKVALESLGAIEGAIRQFLGNPPPPENAAVS